MKKHYTIRNGEKVVKITQKDFNFFKKECEKMLEVLSLKSWSVIYELGDLQNAYGQVATLYEGRCATITLAEYFPSTVNVKEELKTTAIHECLEILTSPLAFLASQRSFDGLEYEKENHVVIRTLENVFKKR